jgi:uncharacterized protein (TIGR04255 family)
MRKEVIGIWERARPVLAPATISRVGLRYINRIDREMPSETAGEWLRATRFIPEAVLTSQPGFLLRLEVRNDRENRVIITIGEVHGPESQRHGSIVFDVDRIVEHAFDPVADTLEDQMNRLHEDLWDVFSSAKTERLERLLNKRATG